MTITILTRHFIDKKMNFCGVSGRGFWTPGNSPELYSGQAVYSAYSLLLWANFGEEKRSLKTQLVIDPLCVLLLLSSKKDRMQWETAMEFRGWRSFRNWHNREVKLHGICEMTWVCTSKMAPSGVVYAIFDARQVRWRTWNFGSFTVFSVLFYPNFESEMRVLLKYFRTPAIMKIMEMKKKSESRRRAT